MRLLWILVTLASFEGDTGVSGSTDGINIQKAEDGRAVNFALETVLEFVNGDRRSDLNLISNVKKFLNTMKDALQGEQFTRRVFGSPGMAFIDFVENSILILISYSDDDLEDLLDVVATEIGRYKRDQRINHFLEEEKLRKYVVMTLSEIQNTSAKIMRKKLNNVYRHIQRMKKEESAFLDLLNGVYQRLGSQKMINVLYNLQTYKSKTKRSMHNLSKIVRHGLRNIFYNPYMNMDPTLRRNFNVRLESYWRDYMNPNKKVEHKIIHTVPKRTTSEREHVLNERSLETHEYRSQSETDVSSSYDSAKTSTEEVFRIKQKHTIRPTKQSIGQFRDKSVYQYKYPPHLLRQSDQTRKRQINTEKTPVNSFLKTLYNELSTKSPPKKRPSNPEDNMSNLSNENEYNLGLKKADTPIKNDRATLKYDDDKYLKNNPGRMEVTFKWDSPDRQEVQIEFTENPKWTTPKPLITSRELLETTRKNIAVEVRDKIKKFKNKRLDEFTTTGSQRTTPSGEWDGVTISWDDPAEKSFEVSEEVSETKPKNEFKYLNNVKEAMKATKKTTTEEPVVDYESEHREMEREAAIQKQQKQQKEQKIQAMQHEIPESDEGLSIEDFIEKSNANHDTNWHPDKSFESLPTDKVVKWIDHLEKELAFVKSKLVTIDQRAQNQTLSRVEPIGPDLARKMGMFRVNDSDSTVATKITTIAKKNIHREDTTTTHPLSNENVSPVELDTYVNNEKVKENADDTIVNNKELIRSKAPKLLDITYSPGLLDKAPSYAMDAAEVRKNSVNNDFYMNTEAPFLVEGKTPLDELVNKAAGEVDEITVQAPMKISNITDKDSTVPDEATKAFII